MENLKGLSGLYPFDFVPKCIKEASLLDWPIFDKFARALEAANEFLSTHPHLRVVSCEVVNFRFRQGILQDQTSSDFLQREDIIKPFVTGLRVWTTPRQEASAHGDRIGYLNCAPLNWSVNGGVEELSFGINDFLRRNPIAGQIISLQTIRFATQHQHQLDLEASSWQASQDEEATSSTFVTFIRLFYLFKPEISRHEVAIADFFPSIVREGDSVNYPKVEALPDVLSRLNAWTNQLASNAALLNVQTVQMAANRKALPQAYNPLLTDLIAHQYHLRFLRAYYLLPHSDQPLLPPSYHQRHIQSLVVSPALLSDPGLLLGGTFESGDLVKDRLHRWVRQSAVQVVAVETLKFKVDGGSETKEGFDGMHTWHAPSNPKHGGAPKEQYVFCFRVYFEGKSNEQFQWPRTLTDLWREKAAGLCSIT